MSQAPFQHDDFEAWLDGQLDPERRAAFDRQVEADPALKQQAALQGEIDAGLRRLFTPPTSHSPMPALIPAPAARWKNWKAGLLATAAVVLLAVAGSWGVGKWREAQRFMPDGLERFDWVYRQRVAEGFDPNMVCENDLQFATAIWTVTQQGLLLNDVDDLRILGFTTSRCFKGQSRVLLTLVQGAPVMVFVAPTANDTRQPTSKAGTLNVFHRTVGPASLYEVTPLPESHLLDRFYDPGFPPETYRRSGW